MEITNDCQPSFPVCGSSELFLLFESWVLSTFSHSDYPVQVNYISISRSSGAKKITVFARPRRGTGRIIRSDRGFMAIE
jgi:hypothetical protein